MPIGEANARHLLRRTEFVDRTSRVDAIKNLTVAQAVDNVIATAAGSAGQLNLGSGEYWQQGQNMTRSWLEKMASSSSPFRERMAFFWHGHICSEIQKVNSPSAMREQIDTFRSQGVNGNFGQMLKDVSLQVAMLRYLDNDRNFANSPNQNFARELKELFCLGVGNYTEADVEAATAAWTGHTAHWEGHPPVQFIVERHEYAAQSYLGQTINQNTKPFEDAGYQTIDVMLGLGDYATASTRGKISVGPNAGKDAREVAATFLSKKLWQEFAEADTGSVPAGVLSAMVDALLDNDFDIKPWVRAMLVHPDFYPDTNPTVEGGLVRQPVEYQVALMVLNGRTASQVAALWLMGLSGQELLYPPNVSGWKPNGYWVNASAMEARNRMAQSCIWHIFEDYWEHPWQERYKNFVQIRGTKIYADEIIGPDGDPNNPGAPWHPRLSNPDLVDKFLAAMDLQFTAAGRQALIDFCASHTSGSDPNWGERRNLPLLIMLAPEMHIA